MAVEKHMSRSILSWYFWHFTSLGGLTQFRITDLTGSRLFWLAVFIAFSVATIFNVTSVVQGYYKHPGKHLCNLEWKIIIFQDYYPSQEHFQVTWYSMFSLLLKKPFVHRNQSISGRNLPKAGLRHLFITNLFDVHRNLSILAILLIMFLWYQDEASIIHFLNTALIT